MPPLTFFFLCPWAWFSFTGACAVGKVLKPALGCGLPRRRARASAGEFSNRNISCAQKTYHRIYNSSIDRAGAVLFVFASGNT